MTRLGKVVLYCLQFYLIVLAILLVVKFLKVIQ
jgi:hypothetical protein